MPDTLDDHEQEPHEPRTIGLRWWQVVVLSLGFLLLYLALALLPVTPDEFYGIRPWWYMPAGLSIALLLFFGLRFALVVFIGAFVAALFAGFPPLMPLRVAVLQAVVITAGYGAASALLRHAFRIHRHFRTPRDVLYFVGVAFIAPLFVGAVNVALLVASGYIPQGAYGRATLNWWIGDSVGIMTVAPFLLTVVFPRLQRWLSRDESPASDSTPARQRGRASWWELALWVIGSVFILWFSFDSSLAHRYHLFYFGFIPLLWITLRYGLPGATTAVLLLNMGAMLALRNAGIIFYSVTDIQLFMLVLSLTGLYLGVTVSLRQRAEETIAQERRRLQTVLQTLPVGVVIADADGRLVDINARLHTIWAGSAPRGATLEEYSAYKGWWVDSGEPLAPEDWAMARALHHGETITAELVDIQRFDDTRATILIGAAPIRDTGGTLIGAVAVVQDVTEQRLLASQFAEVNRALTVLSGANEILIRATDEDALLQDVCELIVNKGNFCLAWVGFAQHDAAKTVRPMAQAGYEAGFLETMHITWADSERGLGPTGTAIRTGKPVVAQNILTDTHYAPWRAEAVSRGYASSIALPLRDNAGTALGSLTIFSPKPDAFNHGEVTLLQELADDLSYGLIALRTREARRQAEEELETIFDAAPMMIIYKDKTGQLLRVNRAYAEASGRSAEELVQLPTAQLYPREDLDKYEQDDREVYTSGQPKLGIIEELETAQGRRLTRTDKVPYHGKDGSILGVIAFVLDITEQKRAEEELEQERALLSSAIDLLPFPILFIDHEGCIFRENNAGLLLFGEPLGCKWWDIELLTPDTKVPIQQAERPATQALHGAQIRGVESLLRLKTGREIPVLIHSSPIYIGGRLVDAVLAIQDITALKEADRAKNEFLAILSHELRTPLTNILGWAREAKEVPEIIPQALDVIERNAHLQHQMLEDLLDISRLVHGKLLINTRASDLWQLAGQAVRDIELRARQHEITVRLEAPDAPLPIQADPRRIAQSIGDLLDNALKFTEPGGVITVRGAREDTQAVLAIHDTGRGIPPEQLPKLFEPFKQIQRTEQTGGLGLGLMLVKGIIGLHGGRVTAYSPGVGQGSTFTIYLPLADGDHADTSSASPAPTPTAE